jgi:hypothetical protein
MEGFPMVHDKSVILTVVGGFSKHAHFISLGHPYTARIVAQTFFTKIVRLHGLPTSIVSVETQPSPALKDRGGDRRRGEWEPNKILSQEPYLCPTFKIPSKNSKKRVMKNTDQ